MNYRALAMGTVLGLLVALTSGCTEKKACGTSNCPQGCCSADGQCVAAPTAQACGASGNACVACAGTESCVSGQCKASTETPTGGACAAQQKCTKADGTCGSTCKVGCCKPDGTCAQTGVSNSACGSNGASCDVCTGGNSCKAVTGGGSCSGTTGGTDGGATGTSILGNPCSANADCAALGQGAMCKKTTTSGSGVYKDGFCTLDCSSATTTDPCEALGGACLGVAAMYGEDDVFCFKNCEDDSACRNGDGYACYNFGVGSGGQCWTDPTPSVDAGAPAPAGVPGKACTLDSECGPPPDQDPFCFTANGSDGGLTGYTAGYCSSTCDIDPETQCGSTGVCLGFCANAGCTETIGLCQQQCNGPLTQANCRDGYVCGAIESADGGSEAYGYCRPKCTNPRGDGSTTRGCATGYTCQTGTGSCCVSDGGSDCY